LDAQIRAAPVRGRPVLRPIAFGDEAQDPLASLRAELIPAAGAETAYGIPLSLENAQTFADWFYNIQLTPEERALFEEVLAETPAPCCDDNSVLKCCCRRTNRICNLTRSALGLAAWLVHVKGFGKEELVAAEKTPLVAVPVGRIMER